MEGKLQQRRPLSKELVTTLWLIAFAAAFFGLFFFSVRDAFSEEIVVVALDLSDSSDNEEFQQNLKAVEKIISDLKPGSRLTIIPIGNESFSRPIILDARLTNEPGLFGERLKKGKRQLIEIWKIKGKPLGATEKNADVFGAIAKAMVVFRENPTLRPVLIILSDMRHVGRRYNFGASRVDGTWVEKMAKDGLIHPLKGVRVWALGVHAYGITELQWVGLRDFWEEFFRRAGAEVVAFTPQRRMNYE